MKKFFASNKANAILHGIKDSIIRDCTQALVEDISEIVCNHTDADHLLALKIVEAIIKKNAKEENIAKRVGDLEDIANYWVRRAEELQETVTAQAQTIKRVNEHALDKAPTIADTTGIVLITPDGPRKMDNVDITLVPIEDDIELEDMDDIDDMDQEPSDDLCDSDGDALKTDTIYFVGKKNGQAFKDGDMSKEVAIIAMRRRDVMTNRVFEGNVIQDTLHFDNAPTNYIFIKKI